MNQNNHHGTKCNICVVYPEHDIDYNIYNGHYIYIYGWNISPSEFFDLVILSENEMAPTIPALAALALIN